MLSTMDYLTEQLLAFFFFVSSFFSLSFLYFFLLFQSHLLHPLHFFLFSYFLFVVLLFCPRKVLPNIKRFDKFVETKVNSWYGIATVVSLLTLVSIIHDILM